MGRKRSLTSGLSVAALAVAVASCGATDDTPGDEGNADRLGAMYTDDGTLDCRRLFTDAPVETLLSAGLTTDMEPLQNAEGDDTGWSYCPSRYVGPGWPGEIAAPLYVATPVDKANYHWDDEPENYRGWEIGNLAMPEGGVEMSALTTVEGRGNVLLMTTAEQVDLDGRNVPNVLGDEMTDALRHVVDSLEDNGSDVLTETDGSVFSDDDRFDCSRFSQRMTATFLQDADLDISDERYAPQRVVERDGSTVSCDLVPESGVNGKPDYGFGNMTHPVEITTGPRDDHAGTPLVGDDALGGWEEYWDFEAAEQPVNVANEGKESYNARFCRSAEDCITVSNFLDSSRENPVSKRPVSPTVQDIKQETLPLLRWITAREGLTEEAGS